MKKQNKTLIIISTILAVIIGGLGAVGYGLYAKINRDGGLTAVLQSKLSNAEMGLTSTIEDTRIHVELSATPIRLQATQIRLATEDTILTLPYSEFGFSLFNLIKGELVPSDVVIRGLDMELIRGQDGWETGSSMQLIGAFIENYNANGVATDGQSSPAPTAIPDIQINAAKLTVRVQSSPHQDDSNHALVFDPINIAMKHQQGRLGGEIAINNAAGGALAVNFAERQDNDGFNFTVAMDKVNVAEIYPYLGLHLPEIQNLGDVFGRVNMIVENGHITGLNGDLSTNEGKTRLPAYGDVAFNDAAILFDYDSVGDRLTVTNFDMTTAQAGGDLSGQIRFSGEVQGVKTNTPSVIAKLRGNRLGFDKIKSLLPKGQDASLQAMINNRFEGGRVDAMAVDIIGTINRDAQRFEIARLDMVTDLRAIRFNTSIATIQSLVGTLNSRLELSIGAEGIIQHAKADFLLRDARLVTTGSKRVVDLEGIELRMQLDGSTLEITRGAVDAKSLGQMALTAKIDFAQNARPHRIDASFRAEQIDKSLFAELWPKTIRPRTRAWIKDRISGGVINGLALNLGVDLPSEADALPSIIYLDGKAILNNTTVAYMLDMPPITQATLALSFQDNMLRADLEQGQVNGIDLRASRAIIRQNEAGPMVDLALLGKGDFGAALALIDNPRLNLLKPAGLNLTKAAGNMDASASMKWKIPPPGMKIKDVGGIATNLSASVVEAEIDGLPGGLALDDANMEIIMNSDKLTITSRGILDGAPAVMAVDYIHRGDLKINVALEKSEAATALVNAKAKLNLGGQTSGVIKAFRRAGEKDMRLDVDFDFSDATINIDRFGLIKLPGEPARFEAGLDLGQGKIRTMGNIRLESEFLSAKGQINFDQSGAMLGAYFNHIAWPGNDISEITLERDGADAIRITADAKLIDLTPLRRDDSPGEGMALDVDITANRVVLDERVSLAGNIKLTTEKNGKGKAEVLGSLFLSGKPFMTESTLKAEFGQGGDVMEGRGLIGGAEASLMLRPSDEGGSVMTIDADNAGQVLKALKVVDGIRGGKLHMVTMFNASDDGGYETHFELEDFRVIEAPTAVRMMSVLSLAGMYSLLEGDGTAFEVGHARIEKRDDRFIIHQARASGNALAVDLVGVVKPETRELEVSGLLLPLFAVTKAIGNVPLIGQILTGLDNDGIFATQFTLRGSIDDPETAVNASSIIPGLFRDVFSPDWIMRERERLTKDGEDGDALLPAVDRVSPSLVSPANNNQANDQQADN